MEEGLTLSSLKDMGREFPPAVDFKPSSLGTRMRQQAGPTSLFPVSSCLTLCLWTVI